MSNLNLSVAVGDYDRNRPLINGAVRIDGVDVVDHYSGAAPSATFGAGGADSSAGTGDHNCFAFQ